MKTQYLFLALALCLVITLGGVSAESTQQNIPNPVKVNECITLTQTCSNCTYVNVTSVQFPNGDKLIINSQMTKAGTEYNYSFCSTSQIGNYIYNTLGDLNGIETVQPVGFEVTPSGFLGTLGFYIILLVIIGGLIILGFAIKEAWFAVFGGLGLIILGIYSINYGIAGFRDMFMTWGIGLFEIGVGAFLAIKSTLEMINE